MASALLAGGSPRTPANRGVGKACITRTVARTRHPAAHGQIHSARTETERPVCELLSAGQTASEPPAISTFFGARAAFRLQTAALESAANGMVITDGRGDIVWTNPAFLRLTGYQGDPIAGRNMRLLK